MEENKYYLPEIEEFHVGFEYEVEDLHDNLVDKMWRKEECYDVPVFLREWIQQGEVRVKQLDGEDIESLGFIQEGQVSFIKNNWYIEWMPGDTLDVFCVSDCRFKGTIKNKSELKKVLKMIGV